MPWKHFLFVPVLCFFCLSAFAQNAPLSPGGSAAATVWNALSAPVMDPARSAHAQNLEIVRDRIRITLIDGTIQLTQPVNGVTFGAAFRGKGRVQVDPPNSVETQQLRFFTKQEKIDFSFTDATFSFTEAWRKWPSKRSGSLPVQPTMTFMRAVRKHARISAKLQFRECCKGSLLRITSGQLFFWGI
jgi:hypothetical protein